MLTSLDSRIYALGIATGGAVYNVNDTANVNFNRFSGNTAATATNGLTLAKDGGGTVDVMNANDNWFGVNTGPAANNAVAVGGGSLNLTR